MKKVEIKIKGKDLFETITRFPPSAKAVSIALKEVRINSVSGTFVSNTFRTQ